MIFDKTKIAEDSKLFYKPGDIVILKHEEIVNRVPMYIVEKVTRQFKKEEIVENAFVGFRCRWFDKNGSLCEAVFSTKDLKMYKK